MKHIVKRAGHTESYDPKKLYASVYASVLSVRDPAGTAEVIADETVTYVEAWIGDKHEITANDLRRVASTHLKFVNPDAALIYEHHRSYC